MRNFNLIKARKILCFLLKVSILVPLFTGLIVHGILAQDRVEGVVAEYLQNSENVSLEDIRISVEFENTPLDEAILQLGEKSGMKFNYNAKLLPNDANVNYRSGNAALADILDSILPSNVSYVAVRNIVILREKKEPQVPSEDYFQEMVSGTVVDAQTEEALPGVNILIQGTERGTVTDVDGNFELEVESLDVTLIVTFVGYERQVVNVAGRTQLDIELTPGVVAGDELVVVGYGSVRKSDLTGSVSSLREQDFNQGVSTSVDQLIGNTVPGVRFVQGNNLPGSGVDISIRGASSINAGTGPLYVVDGLPIDNQPATIGNANAGFTNSPSGRNPLNSINPSDIESIEVLKDASATAIYGNRGANGVIIITTKRGREGDIQINYDGYAGVQTVGNQYDLLNAQEYQRVLNEIIDEGGGQPEFRVGEIANNGTGTNWQDQIYRDAPVTSHNLSFSGGGEATTYFASINYFGQDAIVKNSSLDRFTARLNLDFQPAERLQSGFNISTSYTRDDFVAQGFGINRFAGVIQGALNYDPTLPVRDVNGELTDSEFTLMDNPVAMLEGTESRANTYRTFGTIYGEYSLLPQLTARLNVGGDITNQRRDTYAGELTFWGRSDNGIASVLDGRMSNYLVEGTVNYQEDIGVHAINAVGGLTFQRFLTERGTMQASGFPSDATKTHNLGLADPTQVSVNTNRFSNELVSYLGRINYTLLDRYLFTATFRADGSSRFGAGNRFGFFPSFAVGWNVDQENFMTTFEALSTLKVRSSWGITGNQDIGNLQFATTLGSGPNAIFNDQQSSTIVPTRMGNPDLKWETTRQWNIGLDFGLFDERITGTIDYFDKNTEDMLLALPVPNSTGFSSILTNVGSINNTGLEVGLRTRNVSRQNFQWSSNISFSTLNNEVTDLGGIPEIITGSTSQFTTQIGIIQEGEHLFSFYGWEVDGVWQQGDDFSVTTDNVQPGDLKYRDVNGDGTITAADRVILGNSFPDFNWSVGNTFSYKNFDLHMMVEGVQGIEMLNVNMVDTYFPISFRRNKIAEPYLNRWTPDNPSDKYPSFVRPNLQGNRSVNSRTVEDASYVRLKTVRLSYRLPQHIIGGTMRTATVYMTGENLVTLTDYSGPDPAVNPNANANFRIDWNAAPLVTTYMLGIQLGF